MVDSFFTSSPFLSVWNFITIQAVLYTTIIHYILPVLPWFNFVWFLVFMSSLAGILILAVYKFVIPSLWTWRGTQLYGHQSVVIDQIAALHKEVTELKDAVEKLNKTGQD